MPRVMEKLFYCSIVLQFYSPIVLLLQFNYTTVTEFYSPCILYYSYRVISFYCPTILLFYSPYRVIRFYCQSYLSTGPPHLSVSKTCILYYSYRVICFYCPTILVFYSTIISPTFQRDFRISQYRRLAGGHQPCYPLSISRLCHTAEGEVPE